MMCEFQDTQAVFNENFWDNGSLECTEDRVIFTSEADKD